MKGIYAILFQLTIRRSIIISVCQTLILLGGLQTADASQSTTPTIVLNKMKSSEMSTGPYSFFVPPYSFYYFHNMDKLGFKLDWIRHAGEVYALKNPQQSFTTTYSYNHHTYTLDDYFKRNAVLGFLILKDNQIIYENYFHGSNQDSRFLSNSVGKSITSTLIGVALEEGKIASIDDPVIKYVPALKGSAYDHVTLKQTLEMATAVIASENAFDPNSTVHEMNRSNLHGIPSFTEVLKSLKVDPNVQPGTQFNYTSLNTEVLGLVIENATGMPYNKYLQEKIWSKIGAQSDAFLYRAQAQPDQCAFGCMSATLRDYGRFGLMMMNGGTLGGTRIVDDSWVKQATTPVKYAVPMHDSENIGYGYQWWIPSDDSHAFKGLGIFGQILYINPQQHIVIVETSAWPEADTDERWAESTKVMDAIVMTITAQGNH